MFEGPPWPAVIRDISTTGLGLVTEEPMEPGTFLTVDLNDQRRVTVQTVGYRALGRGRWLIGCLLVRPLPSEELARLI
jgi:hypothetical protein